VLEGLADRRLAGCGEQRGLLVAVLLCGVDQCGQVREALADALVDFCGPGAVALGGALSSLRRIGQRTAHGAQDGSSCAHS
jgi:hypothetical protein